MPVTIYENYGVHKDVKFIQFGEGDIMFTRGMDTELNETHESLVIFSHTEPHKIGAESDEYKGKLSDDLPNIQVIFKFTKPESITALIHTLVEVQKQLFQSLLSKTI